jgi:hypothetical protein
MSGNMADGGAVKWLKRAVALALLALWVPATMHCTLETVPGFSFLQHCCGGDEVPQEPSDCAADFCTAIESGLYKIEHHPTVAPVLPALVAFAAWVQVAEPLLDSTPCFAPASSAPPELPRFWQFHYRTALPPRAPSLLA